MGAANASWNRWVLASLAKHLHAAASVAELPLVIETLDDRSSAFIKAPHKAEATIMGPHTREISPKRHSILVDVFCVVTSQVGGTGYDAGRHRDLAGAIHNALDRSIEIREYREDNESPRLVGCISPRIGDNDAITDTQLRAADTTKEVHSVIEARLQGFFTQD